MRRAVLICLPALLGLAACRPARETASRGETTTAASTTNGPSPDASVEAPALPPAAEPAASAASPPDDASAPDEANAPDAQAQTETACPPTADRPGYEACEGVELTGAPPCEAICRRARSVATPNRCCQDPVEVVVLRGQKALLRLNACSFVTPDCANTHGHGNMSADLHVLGGSPPELVFVEGGCESRAMMHGYVPHGVAAWTGCRHQRYRWDGAKLVKVASR